VDELIDAESLAAAHGFGDPVPVKDLTTWRNLSSDARTRSRAALVDAIGARLRQGSPRTDRAAEYSEVFSEQADRLTMGELHKIELLLDLLERPGTAAKLTDLVERDLAKEDGELGGWIRFDGLDRLTFEEQPAAALNDNSYVFPAELDPHLAAANFHLHAVDSDGNPASAGPSSAFGGTVGDRKAAFAAHRDGVVVTFLGDGHFNVDFYTAGGAVIDLGNYAFAR
jgi:hypothetical protein